LTKIELKTLVTVTFVASPNQSYLVVANVIMIYASNVVIQKLNSPSQNKKFSNLYAGEVVLMMMKMTYYVNSRLK
jgi:hypothetical protein